MAKTIEISKKEAELKGFTKDDIEVLKELEQSFQDLMDGNFDII